MQTPEVLPQHQWLSKLVGEWRMECLVPAQGGNPEQRLEGRESVRMVGDIWMVAEGSGICAQVMTLGFNPATGRYIGTWIGSVINLLWVYDGEMDADGKVLTLHCEGPTFEDPTKLTKYRDVITIIDQNHRSLTGNVLTKDGVWFQMMEAHYHRLVD